MKTTIFRKLKELKLSAGHVPGNHATSSEKVLWESILFFKISEALEIPLLIQATSNVQKIKEMQYSRTEGDEVEDLFLLLERAKEIL